MRFKIKQPKSTPPKEYPIPSSQRLNISDCFRLWETSTAGEKAKSIYKRHKGSVLHEEDSSNSFFVKDTHSNEWTNLEIIAAKFAELTGITVPHTVFAADFDEIDEELKQSSKKRKDYKPSDKEEGKVKYFVASQRLMGYRDLSSFIHFMNRNKHSLVATDQIDAFDLAYEALKQASHKECPSERKEARRDAILQIFKFLPQQLKDNFDEMYAMSMWLGNWDILNFELENCGFCVIHEKDGSISISPAMVDFGNSLYAGFGGKHKEDSLPAANIRAKKPETHPNDYDPEIPDSKMIKAYASAFSKGCEMVRLGNTPRRLPFEGLFKDIDNLTRDMLSDKQQQAPDKLSKGFLRGIYRISLISDEAIDAIADKWFHLGQEINYCYEDKKYTKADLAEAMKGRRDHLKELFAPYIESEKAKDRNGFLIVEREVKEAGKEFAGVAYSKFGLAMESRI